jgi:hypothetical protein
MNAANYKAIKGFRKTIDIKQKVKHGSKERKIVSLSYLICFSGAFSPVFASYVIV